MSDRPPSSVGRIAIKLGPSTTSQPKKQQHHPHRTQPRPSTSSALGKRQRPHGLGGDSESDSEGEESGRHEAITTFGSDPTTRAAANGKSSGDGRRSQQPLVIESLKNRDWRSRRTDHHHGRGRPPPDDQEGGRNGVTKEVEVADGSKTVQWGLSVKSRTDGEGAARSKAASSDDRDRQTNGSRAESRKRRDGDRTDDDVEREALSALMGNEPSSKKDSLVISQAPNGTSFGPRGGSRYDPDLGEVATLQDYESVDTEEFGAALLRGMGWDGKHKGEQHEVKRRPNLMGLGAKQLQGAEELGSWNQKTGKPRPPRLNDYNREEEKKRQKRRDRDRERDR